jgi:hypothetical protein
MSPLRDELTELIDFFELTPTSEAEKKCLAVHTALTRLGVKKSVYHKAYVNAHLMLTRMLSPKPRGRPRRTEIKKHG